MPNIQFTFEELQVATSGTWYNVNNKSCKENGVASVSTDTRKNNKDTLFLALSGKNFDAHNFLNDAIKSKATALCLEEGKFDLGELPSDIPVLEVPDTLKAYQNLANFHRKRLTTLILIAITGSNGKTSTKDILRCILEAKFGEDRVYTTRANTNNLIGVPQNILNITDNHTVAIIELGSNHPGEILELTNIANPNIAVITSLGPAHLEFFKGIKGVIKEKSSIFKAFYNPDRGIAVFPFEYIEHEAIAPLIKDLHRTYTFGENKNADVCFKHLRSTITKTEFELRWRIHIEEISWNIPGKHQIVNAAAAAAAATAIRIISPEKICSVLPKCAITTGMRMAIKKINGITWVNDAYNANPASTEAGIDWLHEIAKSFHANQLKRFFIVLGDMRELGRHTDKIHKRIIKYAFKMLPFARIYGVGSTMCGLPETGYSKIPNPEPQIPNPEFPTFSNAEEATIYFQKELKPGDLIYLKGSRGIALEKIEEKITGT